jgi:hypothetical protein
LDKKLVREIRKIADRLADPLIVRRMSNHRRRLIPYFIRVRQQAMSFVWNRQAYTDINFDMLAILRKIGDADMVTRVRDAVDDNDWNHQYNEVLHEVQPQREAAAR